MGASVCCNSGDEISERRVGRQGILLQQRDVAVAPDREYMLCVRSAMANAERVMSLFIEVRCQRATRRVHTRTHVHAHLQHGVLAAPGVAAVGKAALVQADSPSLPLSLSPLRSAMRAAPAAGSSLRSRCRCRRVCCKSGFGSASAQARRTLCCGCAWV